MKHNRWWRDYTAECAEWRARYGLTSAIDEDGIECVVRLWTTQPVYYGTFTI